MCLLLGYSGTDIFVQLINMNSFKVTVLLCFWLCDYVPILLMLLSYSPSMNVTSTCCACNICVLTEVCITSWFSCPRRSVRTFSTCLAFSAHFLFPVQREPSNANTHRRKHTHMLQFNNLQSDYIYLFLERITFQSNESLIIPVNSAFLSFHLSPC